ncbi:MAG: ROK family protein [Acidobacteria bacterium]|nr:ROK family protein [Acidobacteriota bacterium]MCA1637502.1 ROK family protein [Acidobacteriota bacterium]
MGKEIVLAADLGGTNLRMAAIDCQGEILYRTRRETPRGECADEIVEAIVESANECRENCADFQIKVISAAVPGTVNIKDGVIITAPNLRALNDFGMVAALENELGVKAVLENDANAAAVGENWCGASRGFKDSICITLGTGVGGGIIIDGKILRGADGMAGEIGHICVEPFGAACRCGSRGCVEQYSSASAIVRIAKELEAQYPKSILKNNTQLTAYQVFQAGKDGDKLALEVFRQMGFYLGVALSSLINVLNPQVIVIGGGASAGWELFIPQMQETIRQRAFGGLSERGKIVRGELGDDAGILGTARLAFDSLA